MQRCRGVLLIDNAYWKWRTGRWASRDRGRYLSGIYLQGKGSLYGLGRRRRILQCKGVRGCSLPCRCTCNRAGGRVEREISWQCRRRRPGIGGDASGCAQRGGVGLIHRSVWKGSCGDRQWPWAGVGRRSTGIIGIVAAGQPADVEERQQEGPQEVSGDFTTTYYGSVIQAIQWHDSRSSINIKYRPCLHPHEHTCDLSHDQPIRPAP